MMRRAIVTGANGFIGKTLVDELTERNYSVTALDVRFDESIIYKQGVSCVDVSGKEMDEIAQALSGNKYDCFFHLAWMGTSGPTRASYLTQLNNVKLTCQYVELCKKINCKRMIYASSINEIETYEYLQSDTIEPSGGYIYGTGKLAAHLMGETIAYMNGIEFIPVIITNIFGIGEKSARLVYTSIKKLLSGKHCSFTDGYQTYDFIYITDAITSIIEVSEKGKAFNRYYVGSGEPKPLREFLLKLRDIVAPEAELGFGEIPFNGVNVNYNQFDMKKIENDTGYINQIPFEIGIAKTADYIRRTMENGSEV